MTLELRKLLGRIVAVIMVAAGAGACSSLPGWVDPTSWVGGSDQDASQDSGSDAAQTPDLASIPNKPAPPSTPDEQKQVSDSLAADRASAQYSAEALRGGTEAAAPPPSVAAPEAASSQPQSGMTGQSGTQQVATVPAAQQEVAPPSTGSTAAPAPAPQTASTEPLPPITAPAPAPSQTQPMSASDAQLGFEPSKAPPLDPTVSRYVPRAILEKVQQPSPPAPAVAPQSTRRSSDRSSANDRHGKTSSIVIQRAASAAPAAMARLESHSAVRAITPVSYSSEEQARCLSTIYFRSDVPDLTTGAKTAVRVAADAFVAHGGTGFLRVVGHAPGRAEVMPMTRRLEVIFERSQDYAATVAHELIRDGVPSDKVLVEAVGDSQPAPGGPTPHGEAANRRAEIFM